MTSAARVLFVSRKWPPAVGGMETYSVRAVDALRRYADVETVVLPGRPDGRSPGTLAVLRFSVTAAVAVLRHSRRVDALVVGDFALAFLAVLHRFVAPRATNVVIIHGLDVLYGEREGWIPWVYRTYTKVMRRGLRRTVLIANSRATASAAAHHGFSGVSVVPLGVDLRPLDENHVSARNREWVLFVGRLVPRKGAAWFAEEVLPLLPGTRFLVVGSGSDERELKRILASPRAEYLGRVDDEALVGLRRAAWVSVMPNLPVERGDIEGFGLAAIEAAAEGCVVLAAGIDGVTDALGQGSTGILLTAGDALTWATAIEEVQGWDANRYTGFATEVREELRENFDWDRVGREIASRAGLSGVDR